MLSYSTAAVAIAPQHADGVLTILGIVVPLVRGLIAAGLLLLVGYPVAVRLANQHGPAPGSMGRLAVDGWFIRLPGLLAWFLLTCSLVRGALQLLTFVEPGETISADLAHAVLLEGSWGGAWVAQSSAALILLAISWLWRGRPQLLAIAMTVLIMILIAAQTFLGHGVEDLWTGSLGQVVHGVHLLGSGIWLGTLAVLALTTFPALRDPSDLPTLTALTQAYSRPARLGVVLVIASGVLATWSYSGGHLLALIDVRWGQLLLIKLAMVAGAFALGGWNWRVGTPALIANRPGAAAKMRRAIVFELMLGLLILGITAWLIGSPLPSPGG